MTNTVIVGPREALGVRAITGRSVTWCDEPVEAGSRVGVQVRAHGAEVVGTVGPVGPDGVVVRLDGSISGVAPGQTMALYSGTRVRGAATIASGTTEPAA